MARISEQTVGRSGALRELQRIITELNRAGQTILLVEQNVRLALAVAHHVYVIRQGAVVLDHPVCEIADSDEVFRTILA